MTRIVTILTEGFADWEAALLNGAAHAFYGVETHFASPGGLAVTSLGGMRVTPDRALERLEVDDYDAIVVVGGSIWQSGSAPDLSRLFSDARAQGKVIGAICDATLAAAGAGLLDDVAHTSNGVGHLDATGYSGKAHYRDVASAVSENGVVTAPGTAPVSFMAEILRGLGIADDNLDLYLGMHAAEHRPAA